MKITLFTSNQPRHLSLAKKMALICDEVFVVQEVNTVFPGKTKDFFDNSLIMQSYFKNVIEAEKEIFGSITFLPSNVHQLAIKSGDLNKIDLSILDVALHSDIYIVFGASYIKEPLIDFLVEKKAINIHMGVSPYYRGSSCNFWASYDGHPELIGATIHMLNKGLDSGEILWHALPAPMLTNCFEIGMQAVKVAHDSLTERIKNREIFHFTPVKQDKSLEIRYTKNIDFNDSVVRGYLDSMPTSNEVLKAMSNRNMNMFLNPYIK